MENNTELLKQGLQTAFLSKETVSNTEFTPKFVSNNYKQGKKVISSIEDELLMCDEFYISVAFITMGGITPLLQTFKELERRNIPGKIITTDYLTFTDPKALKTLASLKNIEIKMYCTQNSKEGFHTKGYIFKKNNLYRMIIGSSNMTMSALTINREWNTKIISARQGEYAFDVLREWNQIWNANCSLEYDECIKEYSKIYTKNKIIQKQKQVALQLKDKSLETYHLKPNVMQVACTQNLREILEEGENRALLISATGTGKTYASAFAMRDLGFKRVLFVVHRKQIAKQAKKSFQKVFGNTISTCFLNSKKQGDYVFATIQTLCKEEVLHSFSQDTFDAIIIDEAHHSAANSYKKILDYFKPTLWLGMTATPDKRDDNIDGKNIYEIFDHNIACEIRLQDAMEENMLCPFHYFGITDLDLIQDEGKTKEEKIENFSRLTSDARVEHIMGEAKYYGYSGKRVKGLIFCSRIEEAKVLSEKMNQKGWKTVALSGSDSEDVRSSMVERLAKEEGEDCLDYILSVDIFSEGVDVPEINQVIMLRPTQSPVVFVQQLGRGLRKAEDKEYVVVLDFIGNYKNNFMIPIALSGDRSYNKDNIRKYVAQGDRIIPGESTIHFDEIARKKIYQAIDDANFSDIKLIKENYISLKNKLGHIPALSDFDTYGEMDVLRIFDNKSLGSYYKFLVKYEKEYTVRLSKSEEIVLEFISKKLASGKRIYELELFWCMLDHKDHLVHVLKKALEEKYAKFITDQGLKNVINVMTNSFLTKVGRKTYQECIFIEEDEEDYKITPAFEKMLENPNFKSLFKELIQFGQMRYKKKYQKTYEDTDFVLYEKYTYEDACRLLQWDHNEVPLNIGGYKYDQTTKTFPVFINYDKQENISDTIKYEDHFINENSLIAVSKSGRSLASEDVQKFLHAKEKGIDVQLFIRKNKDDKISKEFYYLGRMEATGKAEEITMPNTHTSAVEMEWRLHTPVREDVYAYIVS